MGGLGFPELIVIFLIALLIFGTGRLPEAGKALGKAIRGFKEAVEGREIATAQPTQGRACPSCGKGYEEGASFCPECGRPLREGKGLEESKGGKR